MISTKRILALSALAALAAFPSCNSDIDDPDGPHVVLEASLSPVGGSTELAAQRDLLGRFVASITAGPAIVVGNSMGGLLAMMEAAAEPERVSHLMQQYERTDGGARWRRAGDDFRFVRASEVEVGGGHHIRGNDVVAVHFGHR